MLPYELSLMLKWIFVTVYFASSVQKCIKFGELHLKQTFFRSPVMGDTQ